MATGSNGSNKDPDGLGTRILLGGGIALAVVVFLGPPLAWVFGLLGEWLPRPEKDMPKVGFLCALILWCLALLVVVGVIRLVLAGVLMIFKRSGPAQDNLS